MSTASMVSKGIPVDPSLVGEFNDSSALLGQPERLRERLQGDGYLLLRGVFDPAAIAAARHEIFSRLAEVGEVREPVEARR